jgi:hypothetical protein
MQDEGIKLMTEAQKAATFDRLQQTRGIQVRKDASSGTLVTRIEHGDTKSINVDDFVVSLESEDALRASLETEPPPMYNPRPVS